MPPGNTAVDDHNVQRVSATTPNSVETGQRVAKSGHFDRPQRLAMRPVPGPGQEPSSMERNPDSSQGEGNPTTDTVPCRMD